MSATNDTIYLRAGEHELDVRALVWNSVLKSVPVLVAFIATVGLRKNIREKTFFFFGSLFQVAGL